MAGRKWTDAENDLIVATYFAMLEHDLKGRPYSKAEHNRRLQGETGRTRGSIEYKLQNVSAVLRMSGEVWIPGYKPASNYQHSLIDAVYRWLDTNRSFVDRPLVTNATNRFLTDPWLRPPPMLKNEPSRQEREMVDPIIREFDFSGRDQRNRELGKAGEEFALDMERRELTNAGHRDLAKRIRWVSQEEGDGAGYDIASFFRDGRNRLIEVKTTVGWERSSFHITRNELDVASARPDEWRLLRVWDFSRAPKAFELMPPLDRHVHLTASSFIASFG